MCLHAVSPDILILGTLEGVVEAYNTKTRRLISEVKLNDAVLCLSHHTEEGSTFVYAGLADGTLAIVENLCTPDKKTDVFHIVIGSSPVSCLLILDRTLWCSCGNRISIIHVRTLDPLDKFKITCNDMDHISTLALNVHGIWISIRGSSVLQVWDPKTLTCKLTYDIQSKCYNSDFKEEEMIFHPMSVTSVLPLTEGVVVGMSNGWMLVFNVICRRSCSISVAQFYNGGEREQDLLEEFRRQERLHSLPSSVNDTLSDLLSDVNSFHSFPVTSYQTDTYMPNLPPVIRPRSAPGKLKQTETTYDVLNLKPLDSRSLPELMKCKRVSSSPKDEHKYTSISSVDLRQACGLYGLPKRKGYSNDTTRFAHYSSQPGVEKSKARPSSSTTASLASFGSLEVPYGLEIVVKEKINIADKPIKCLLKAKCGNEENIISCAGHYGEEDSVLKWTKEGDEMLWSSEPVFDVCPQAKPADTKGTSYFPPSKFFSSNLVSSAVSPFEKFRKPSAANTSDYGLNRMQEILFRVTK